MRVVGEETVACNHLIAVSDDGVHFSRLLEHANDAVGVADARQKDRVVEVEDDGRTAPRREPSLDERRPDWKDLTVNENDVVARHVAQRIETLHGQGRERDGFAYVMARLVDEPEELRREQRAERDR